MNPTRQIHQLQDENEVGNEEKILLQREIDRLRKHANDLVLERSQASLERKEVEFLHEKERKQWQLEAARFQQRNDQGHMECSLLCDELKQLRQQVEHMVSKAPCVSDARPQVDSERVALREKVQQLEQHVQDMETEKSDLKMVIARVLREKQECDKEHARLHACMSRLKLADEVAHWSKPTQMDMEKLYEEAKENAKCQSHLHENLATSPTCVSDLDSKTSHTTAAWKVQLCCMTSNARSGRWMKLAFENKLDVTMQSVRSCATKTRNSEDTSNNYSPR
mmetsp:Transcript_37252/g.71425  ORF Transcript_37252/g.71425 Transcript_37252/m.71425 type:complete len:280 (+) Transcript_37252:453-1292(+)